MDPESQVRLEGFFRTGGSGRKDAQEELDEEIFGEGGCPEWDFGISCTISWSTRQCHPLFGTHNLNGFSSCGCWSCFSIAFFLGKQEEISRPLRDRLRNPATDGSWKSVSWRGCSEWGHSTGILWSANPPSIDLWGLLSKRAALEIDLGLLLWLAQPGMTVACCRPGPAGRSWVHCVCRHRCRRGSVRPSLCQVT